MKAAYSFLFILSLFYYADSQFALRRCRRPNDPPNGTITPSFPFYTLGQQITYTCPSGYRLTPLPTYKRRCTGRGSFYPRLIRGLRCIDIDECLSDPCDVNAMCTNVPADFTCTCNNGFEGDGMTCQDIDECANNPCDASAICVNSPGSFACTCSDGFFSNGTSCLDIDECATISPCQAHATCTNLEGGYSCNCNEGFRESDSECLDIDECLEAMPCHIHAFCINNEGSYTCTCYEGFHGDGINCRSICPDPEVPENGQVISLFGRRSPYLQGDRVLYVCNGNYLPSREFNERDSHAVCTEEGEWSIRAPVCVGSCYSVCDRPRILFPERPPIPEIPRPNPENLPCGCDPSCLEDNTCCFDYVERCASCNGMCADARDCGCNEECIFKRNCCHDHADIPCEDEELP